MVVSGYMDQRRERVGRNSAWLSKTNNCEKEATGRSSDCRRGQPPVWGTVGGMDIAGMGRGLPGWTP